MGSKPFDDFVKKQISCAAKQYRNKVLWYVYPKKKGDSMKSIIEIKIRSFHTDCFGIIHHARYLELLEEGRWTYLEDNPDIARVMNSNNILHSVVHIDISYREEAKLGDILRIETGVDSAGKSSVTMLQNIYRKNTEILIATAKITNVYFQGSPQNLISLRDDIYLVWNDLQKILK